MNKRFFIIVLIFIASCGENKPIGNSTGLPAIGSIPTPQFISYQIINEYPHDPTAFTEGLEYKDGFLFESTGEYGISEVRKVELKTGKVLQSQKLLAEYFGEGLTLLNGKLYQLTYREKKGFVYDPATLRQTKTFVTATPEAWGMTNNGTNLIYDDGTNLLHYIDPNTFKEIRALKVTDNLGAVMEINELEFINGFIYANQWKTEYILKIDTATGLVVAKADLGNLRQMTGIPAMTGRKHSPDVLNGIAYDLPNNRIFITGKNWPKLFEIKLDN